MPSTRLRAEPDFTLFPWPDTTSGGPVTDLTAKEWETYKYGALPDERDGTLDRMLGHPDLIQDTPTPGEDILLLQIDGDVYGVHSVSTGRVYYLITEVDLRERRFDRAYFDYECD